LRRYWKLKAVAELGSTTIREFIAYIGRRYNRHVLQLLADRGYLRRTARPGTQEYVYTLTAFGAVWLLRASVLAKEICDAIDTLQRTGRKTGG
jgi:hypothetical protein